MNRIYLSLGTNLGDRKGNITEALRLLSEHIRLINTSSFYETEPVGYRDQPWFFNIAAEGETELSPQALLDFTQGIERRMKRVKTISNGPRVIDIDILLYDDEIITSEALTIPHPRMLERAFVLVPLAEIAPALLFSGISIGTLISELKGEDVHLWSPA